MNTAATNPDMLTAQQYREAFQKIHGKLTAMQLLILRVHYHAPERKISARQMAKTVGYPNFSSVNLQYGMIGGLLCDILGQKDGSDRLFILARFIRPQTEGNTECLWQMRVPVAQALQELGWVVP